MTHFLSSKLSARRPPPHIRAQLDLAFRISGQSIEIFEIRPDWRDKGKTLEEPVAKATYNKNKEWFEVHDPEGVAFEYEVAAQLDLSQCKEQLVRS